MCYILRYIRSAYKLQMNLADKYMSLSLLLCEKLHILFQDCDGTKSTLVQSCLHLKAPQSHDLVICISRPAFLTLPCVCNIVKGCG